MINYWIVESRKLLLFGCLPILIGLLLGWQGWERKQRQQTWVENLRGADGRVLGIESRGGELLVNVEYLDVAGVKYEKKFRVEPRQEAGLRAVGKVSVAYDARDPRVVVLGDLVDANSELTVYVGMTGLGGLLVLGALGMIGLHAKRTIDTRGLFEAGELVESEVRDSKLAPGKEEGRFTYAFRGPNGRWYEGKSPELPAVQLAKWPVGRKVLIAYDRAHPRRSEVDVFGMVSEKRRSGFAA